MAVLMGLNAPHSGTLGSRACASEIRWLGGPLQILESAGATLAAHHSFTAVSGGFMTARSSRDAIHFDRVLALKAPPLLLTPIAPGDRIAD